MAVDSLPVAAFVRMRAKTLVPMLHPHSHECGYGIQLEGEASVTGSKLMPAISMASSMSISPPRW